MNTQKSSFPVQKLARSKKTQEWKEDSVDAIIAREGSSFVGGTDRKGTMLTAYGLYNSEYDENDLKYVTNPFKVDDGFPAKMQNFNIIRPKIDLLIGEESKRPFNIKVVQTNYDAVTKIQEEKKNLLLQYIQSYIGLSQDEQGQPITPPEIEKYMKYNYKTISEETAYHTLNYLREKLNLPNEFLKGWKDALISSEEIYYVGVINGEPSLERVNPLNCDYDKDPDLEFIEDGDWFLRRMEMSPATIYDRFFDMLDESDLDKILEYAEGRSGSLSNVGSDVNTTTVMYKEKFSNKFLNSNATDIDGNLLTVYHAVWRSYAMTGFLTSTDPETGETLETLVDESYKAGPGEEIRWEYVPEIWEGYRAGDDVYFGIGPVDYQHVSIDNPSNRKLPYCGTIYSNINSKAKSLVTIMKPLQYMYIILWYRLELALARDKGKNFIMDITQIPKGLGISVEQWMHYASALGVIFVNPYDEGWDIPGREGGKPAAFNQMTAIDLSMANIMSEYISLMVKIEDMIGELSGVSKQRQGAISSNELVGNVERAVIQSSHITEPLFWVHNQVKKNALTMLLDTAKSTWSEKKDKKLHYVMNDAVRIFMDVTDDFLYSDHDIFFTDSTKESQNIELMKSLLQHAMTGGATMLEAAEVITGDNLSMIKKRLSDIDQKKAEMIAQQQQMQQQAAALEMQMKQEELRIKEEDSIRKAETALQVAIIQANSNSGSEEGEIDEEGNTLEYQKLMLQAEKIKEEIRIKDEQVKETIRKNKKTEDQKDVELQIRRTVANKPVTSKPSK